MPFGLKNAPAKAKNKEKNKCSIVFQNIQEYIGSKKESIDTWDCFILGRAPMLSTKLGNEGYAFVIRCCCQLRLEQNAYWMRRTGDWTEWGMGEWRMRDWVKRVGMGMADWGSTRESKPPGRGGWETVHAKSPPVNAELVTHIYNQHLPGHMVSRKGNVEKLGLVLFIGNDPYSLTHNLTASPYTNSLTGHVGKRTGNAYRIHLWVWGKFYCVTHHSTSKCT